MENRPPVNAAAVPAGHRAYRPRWVRRFAGWLFGRLGWAISGEIPAEERLILVVGPHTSNWDFLVGVLAMLALDIRLHFLAKHSLFAPPLGTLMKALGGIPINRSRPEGFATDAAALIADSDELILAITPEGTRSRVEKLKSGFSRIAAAVPCRFVPVLLDFGAREIRLLPPRSAGEPREDADAVRRLFATVSPKNPANF